MSRRTATRLALLLVLLGLGLRVLEAFGTSLWLDEYHTLWVADVDSFAGVVARIERDFHPPLFYWGLSFLRGVDPELQRLVPIAFSLLGLLPLLGLARAAGLGPLATLTACALFLLLPYQVHYAAELRAYSALQVAGATLAWAAFSTRAGRGARLTAFALATALGLYVHYFAGVGLLLIGGFALVWRPAETCSRRGLVLAGGIGCLAFLPWILAVEGWLLQDPGRLFRAEPVEADDDGSAAYEARNAAAPGTPDAAPAPPPWWKRDTRKALQVPAQLLVPTIGTLAGTEAAGTHAAWRVPLLRAASLALFALAALAVASFLGGALLRRGARVSANGWATFACGTLALVLVTVLLMVVWKSVRLQYFAVVAWFPPLLIAAGVHVLPRRGAVALASALALAAFAAGLAYAEGPSREDLDAGLRVARSLDPDGDAIYTAVLWQPPWYPHVMPYTYTRFAGDVREPWDVPPGSATNRPVLLVTRTITLDGPRALPPELERIVDGEIVKAPLAIRTGRRLTHHVQVDHATHVYRFEVVR